ncbi:MAG TPA: hypothetical protein VIO58_08905 [Candidatus Methanoperedens sp.]
MEAAKIECENTKITFEGELNPEISTTNLHPRYHIEDEDYYTTAGVEFKVCPEVNISDLEKMYAWINKNSKVSADVKECSKWRITLERLP